jgi:hypothetical protein
MKIRFLPLASAVAASVAAATAGLGLGLSAHGAYAASTPTTAPSPAADAASAPVWSLKPGWEAHTKPLLYRGSKGSRTIWLVPNTLPKGNYRVISRAGDTGPHVVGGAQFTVNSAAYRDINLFIDTFERSPEAIDEQWVVLPENESRALSRDPIP